MTSLTSTVALIHSAAMEHVSWTSMENGTQSDYEFLGSLYTEHANGELVENLVNLLKVMEGPKLGYQIDRYQHCLQSATRALRNDESLDLVVAALLHDVGDPIAPANHSALAASMLKPYVDDETHWVVKLRGFPEPCQNWLNIGSDAELAAIVSQLIKEPRVGVPP